MIKQVIKIVPDGRVYTVSNYIRKNNSYVLSRNGSHSEKRIRLVLDAVLPNTQKIIEHDNSFSFLADDVRIVLAKDAPIIKSDTVTSLFDNDSIEQVVEKHKSKNYNLLRKALAMAMCTAVLSCSLFSDDMASDNVVISEAATEVEEKEPMPLIIAPLYLYEEETVFSDSDFDIIKKNISEFSTDIDDAKMAYVRENYNDTTLKYSSVMGIDPELIRCIMAQERYKHSSVKDAGGGIGLMQIQYSWHVDETIRYFNYEKDEWESFKATKEVLQSLDGNVKTGTALLQNAIFNQNGNVFAATIEYNLGEGMTTKLLKYYADVKDKSLDEVKNDYLDLGWSNYRKAAFGRAIGDDNYLNNVFRRFKNDTLTVNYIDDADEKRTVSFSNKDHEDTVIRAKLNPQNPNVMVESLNSGTSDLGYVMLKKR